MLEFFKKNLFLDAVDMEAVNVWKVLVLQIKKIWETVERTRV